MSRFDAAALPEYYASVKAALAAFLGEPEALLHMQAGLLIFVISAVLLRCRMRSFLPLALVFLLAIANEILDALGPKVHTSGEPMVDIANTVFWPMVVCLAAGLGQRPRSYRMKRAAD